MDQERAKNQGKFGTTKDRLVELSEIYKKKHYCEDLDQLKNEYNDNQGLFEALGVTSLQSGISVANNEDFNNRILTFGSNARPPYERGSFCGMVLVALDDFMLKLLIVCAIVSIVVEVGFNINDPEKLATAWIEGFAILVAVAVVSLVGAWSDFKKEGQFLENQKIADKQQLYVVVRDNAEVEIHRDNIVVGDVIKIKDGMQIPVDGVVLIGISVMADESSMTGESDHLSKENIEKCSHKKDEFEADNKGSNRGPHDVPSPLLISGTTIQTGQGFFICTVVGEMTQEGQILASVEAKEQEQTPLQKKLDQIALDIGKLGMYAALLIIHCLILRSFIEGLTLRKYDLFGGEYTPEKQPCNPGEENCTGLFISYIKDYLHYLIIGVTIVVVAVPEGLPLAVMISLAYSVQRMLEDKNFVKKLTSCEIMGGANNICSDKTGTLTLNQMTWTQIHAGEDASVPDVNGYPAKFANPTDFIKSDLIREMLGQAIGVNCEGTVETGANATELAMLKFAERLNFNVKDIRAKYIPSIETLIRFPFDSARKRMTTLIELTTSEKCDTDYKKRLHMKGASEIILDTCTHYLDSEGQRQRLQDSEKQRLNEIILSYARKALRTICFAYKDLEANECGADHLEKDGSSKIYKVEETGFTLVCIAGIKDIIRAEVPDAVADCNTAGIRVRMVTGDNKITATAIAKECHIIKDGEDLEEHVCMTGPEFAEFVGGIIDKRTGQPVEILGKEKEFEKIGNPENFKKIRSKLKVLARSRPNDKYIMVAGLRECGDIVAVTGDGTNDAPALKKADVGFAMQTGTMVAHNAASIIIQDDNFASIVKACSWGRNVYDNIRRFLQFQLTVNVVALVTSFIGSVILKESPLAAIQLLWVNLIMDSLASLALATEKPKPELLQRPPYRKNEYIINKKMVKHILGQSIFQCIILFICVFAGQNFIPEGVEGGMNITNDASLGITAQQVLDHPNPEYQGWTGEFVFSGMVSDFKGQPVYEHFNDFTSSRHLTVVFNLFVFFQIFNMLASRKINDEINIFSGMFENGMFVSVWLIIVVCQVLIVQFGSTAMKCHRNGLTLDQWIICIVLSVISLLWNIVLKFIPDDMCMQLGNERPSEVAKAKLDYDTLRNLASTNRANIS